MPACTRCGIEETVGARACPRCGRDPARRRRGLAAGAGLLVAVAAILVGGGMRGGTSEHGLGAVFGLAAGGPIQDGSAEQRVAGLCVRSPRAFARQPDPTSGAVVRGGVDRAELFESESGALRLLVTRVVYMPSVQPSLQAAVDGYVSELVQFPGSRGHGYANRPAMVSAYPALHTTARFEAGGRAMRAEAITFVSNRTLWQVQALFADSELAADAALGVLASVAVQESTPGGGCAR